VGSCRLSAPISTETAFLAPAKTTPRARNCANPALPRVRPETESGTAMTAANRIPRNAAKCPPFRPAPAPQREVVRTSAPVTPARLIETITACVTCLSREAIALPALQTVARSRGNQCRGCNLSERHGRHGRNGDVQCVPGGSEPAQRMHHGVLFNALLFQNQRATKIIRGGEHPERDPTAPLVRRHSD